MKRLGRIAVILTVVVALLVPTIVFAGPASACEGCTPGYWRQEQHFDSWVYYSPSDNFNAIFGDPGPDITLLQALYAHGHQYGQSPVENALVRHAAAALLNGSAGIGFYTSVEVKDMYLAAYDPEGYGVEYWKDELEWANELGCPFD
jgi:hypothetical protein